jgi:hypothetical protein
MAETRWHGPERQRSRGPRWAIIAIGLAVVFALGAVAISLGFAGLVYLADRPPETPNTPETVAEATSWSGFPDTSGLTARDVYRETDRNETRSVLFEGPPEAVDRLLAAGDFTAERSSCTDWWLPELGETKLADCGTAWDEWLPPGRDPIKRDVVVGRLADGTYIVYLRAFEIQPKTGTTK